jgi:DNA-binding MarR family transcriptional regulator
MGNPTADSDTIKELRRALVTLTRRVRGIAALSRGLSFAGTAILVWVDQSADAHATSLADELGLDKSTVCRQLAEVERQGLLRKEPHPVYPRMQRLKLTVKGRRLLSSTVAHQCRQIAEILRDWPEPDVVAFHQLVRRFARDADRADNSAPAQTKGRRGDVDTSE